MNSADLHSQTLQECPENYLLANIFPSPNAKFIRSKCQKPKFQSYQEEESKDNILQQSYQQESKENVLQESDQEESKDNTLQEINENVISVLDGRTQIHTTYQWPYSAIGVTRAVIGRESVQGTGILIGPNIVLTAGHNLYNFKDKQRAALKSVRFIPGANGKDMPFGEIRVRKYFVSPIHLSNGTEDYAILILKESIGERTGFYGVACLDPEELKNREISVTGYPSDKVKKKPKTCEMWGMRSSTCWVDTDENYIHYPIDTHQGQSGSGAVCEENEEYFVCGVHVKGRTSENLATFLTRNRYKQIYVWIQEWIKENARRELPYFLGEGGSLKMKTHKLGEGLISFLSNDHPKSLKALRFRWNIAENAALRLLGQNLSWINLSSLNLKGNNMGDEGAKALAQNTSWVHLSWLNLERNNIGDEGAKALAGNTSWARLLKLDLRWNHIGEKGAKALKQNILWIHRLQLNIGENYHLSHQDQLGLPQEQLEPPREQLRPPPGRLLPPLIGLLPHGGLLRRLEEINVSSVVIITGVVCLALVVFIKSR